METTADGCSLDGTEMADRLAAWSATFGALESRERTPEGFVLRFDPAVEAEVRRLAALEAHCCQSLTFVIRREDGRVRMDVEGQWEDTPWRMAMAQA